MAQANILQFLRSNNPLPNIVQQAGAESETQTMDDAGLNKLIEEMGSPQAVFEKYYGANGSDPRAGLFSLSEDGQTVNFKSDKENDSWEDFGGGLGVLLSFAGMAAGAGAISGAMGGAAGAGAGLSESALASADIALGGAGGSAGAASLGGGAATGGSFIGDMIQKGVDWLGGGTEGGFDIGKAFNSFTDSVSNFFSPAADSPWGVNAVSDATTGMAGDTAGSLSESQMGMGGAETVATQAADAAGVSTNAADFAFTPTQASMMNPEATNLVPQVGMKEKGLIDRVIDWGTKNPVLASGVLKLGGGLLRGVGDAAAMDKKIAAEKEIAAGRSPEAILAAQRANAASSGAYGQRLGFQAPNTPRVLRRPDGSIVYAQPGLIAGKMKG